MFVLGLGSSHLLRSILTMFFADQDIRILAEGLPC